MLDMGKIIVPLVLPTTEQKEPDWQKLVRYQSNLHLEVISSLFFHTFSFNQGCVSICTSTSHCCARNCEDHMGRFPPVQHWPRPDQRAGFRRTLSLGSAFETPTTQCEAKRFVLDFGFVFFFYFLF
jgi:hypothetical protein